MFKPVSTIQIYDEYLIDLVNKVACSEGRRPSNCARFYLTKILTDRLNELSSNHHTKFNGGFQDKNSN